MEWSGVRVSETKSETQEGLARGFSKIKCSSSKRGKGKEMYTNILASDAFEGQ